MYNPMHKTAEQAAEDGRRTAREFTCTAGADADLRERERQWARWMADHACNQACGAYYQAYGEELDRYDERA